MERWILYIIMGMIILQVVSAVQVAHIEREWNILAIGDEYALLKGITYKNINSTATRFYIKYQPDYNPTAELTSRDITKVPVEKTTYSNTVSLDKTSLDLSKDGSILIQYEAGEDASFKVGWESVVIDSSASQVATQYASTKSICHSPNGRINVAYVGSGTDMFYANSTDGTTWTTLEIVDGVTASIAGVLCKSNNDLMVYYINGGDLDALNYTQSTNSWSAVYTLEDDIVATLMNPSCDLDKNDIFHCCVVSSTDNIYYVNSSNIDDVTIIESSSGYDMTSCSLRFAPNDCMYIVGTDNSEDNYKAWSNCLNGLGQEDFEIVYGGVTTDPTQGDEITISFKSSLIVFSLIENGDLVYCNQGLEESWSPFCKYIDSDVSNNPDIAINSYGSTEILYSYSASGTGDIYRANLTGYGSWTNRTIMDGGRNGAWASISDTTYPSSNKLTDTVHYVYNAVGASDVIYDSYVIPYIAPVLYGDNTSFTVQLPSGQSQAVFTALNKSHKYVAPAGQTDLIPFFNITNIGNASLNVSHLLNQTLPSDVVYMVNDEYVNIEAIPIFDYLQQIHNPLLPDVSIGIWIWTNFTNSLPQTINRAGNISVYNNT